MRRCLGCSASLEGAHPNRKWCSERCRKQSAYGGTCAECGKATDGSNGPGTAPKLCSPCHNRSRKYWTRRRIIYAIERWAAKHGEPPTAHDWNATKGNRDYIDGVYPSIHTVQEVLGSWNKAIAAAGYQPRRSGQRRY